jgi:pyruvate/2-oxoglutarate dehydrogenase complex dihydrolipoamide acyltransferase (E2) component
LLGCQPFDLVGGCGTITFVRWLIALIVVFVAAQADAGVFKARGGDPKAKPGAKAPAKPETTKAAAKTDPAPKKAAPPATAPKKMVTRGPAPKKAPAGKAAAPKKGGSRVATKGRPDDLTPDVKKDDVVITEDSEEDVIIRDDD